MSGFKPLTTGIGSNHSTNWATTTAHLNKSTSQIYIVTQPNTFRIKQNSTQEKFKFNFIFSLFWNLKQRWKNIIDSFNVCYEQQNHFLIFQYLMQRMAFPI